MALNYKQSQSCTDHEGNKWEVNYVKYDKADGDYDEVMQVKKNGREEGHTTWHYDKNRRLLKMNDGAPLVPCNLS